MNKELVIISTKKVPLWRKWLVYGLLGLAALSLLYAIIDAIFDWKYSKVWAFLGTYEVILVLVVTGLAFHIKKTVLLDLVHKSLKSELSLGRFKRGEWETLPKIDYVAVFSNEPNYYQINLWHHVNKHMTIFDYSDKDVAMYVAVKIADQLDVKLLDATDRKNKFYVSLEDPSQQLVEELS